jgi:DNA-binding MarR family transcriptional regulator
MDPVRAKLADHPVPLLMDVLVRALNDAIDAALAASPYADIRRSHGAVFETIDPGGSRVVDMAERARMTKQGMGQLVAAVEALGYVERRPDPGDARARRVLLTPRGRRAAETGIAALAAVEAAWREQLGERRWRDLRRSLEELCATFGRDLVR